MSVEDMEINQQVRSLLARNWVSLQNLDLATTSGVVYIRGRMVLLTDSQIDPASDRDRSGVGPRFLARLEEDLLKINKVRAVNWELEGWRRAGLGWRSGH